MTSQKSGITDPSGHFQAWGKIFRNPREIYYKNTYLSPSALNLWLGFYFATYDAWLYWIGFDPSVSWPDFYWVGYPFLLLPLLFITKAKRTRTQIVRSEFKAGNCLVSSPWYFKLVIYLCLRPYPRPKEIGLRKKGPGKIWTRKKGSRKIGKRK